MEMKLHRSDAAARELRSGLDSERENSLDWMERHNKERDKVSKSSDYRTEMQLNGVSASDSMNQIHVTD